MQYMLNKITHLAVFFKFTKHDDGSTLQIVHHLPKVPDCTLHWGLGHHKCLLLLVTLCTTS